MVHGWSCLSPDWIAWGWLWFFRYLERHAGDYECMTVPRDQVVIERWDRGSVSGFDFNRHRVQTTFIEAQGGERGRLMRRSDGKKEVAFGIHLTGEQRAAVARRLNEHLKIR